MTIVLPFASPSQNQTNAWHWGRRGKHRDTVQMLVRQQLRKAGFVAVPLSFVRVHITRYSAGELDEGNMVGGLKGTVDALVREGLLHDDSPKWCAITYEQRKSKRAEARTVIEIGERT